MAEHWAKIDYKADTDTLNEVNQVELEVQVGGLSKNQIIIPDSSLTNKYTSVVMRGFRKETTLEEICQVINQEGFLGEFRVENILRNEATGSLTLLNLKPEECLLLVEKMNRKSFLGRQLFVTSVVAESPVKTAPVVPTPDKPLPGAPGSVQNSPAAQSAANSAYSAKCIKSKRANKSI